MNNMGDKYPNLNKSKKNSVRLAILLAVFSSLGPFTVDTYLPAFPQMMRYFGTTASMIQVSLTACMIGMSIGMLVMGSISDIHGRRKPLLISMIIYLVSSFACVFAPNIEVLIALRFIQGFAASAGVVISRAIVSDLYSGIELTKFFSLLMMFTNLAPLLAPLAGSAVLAFSLWTGVFLFLGVLGILLTSLTAWGLTETLPAEKRVPNNVREFFSNFTILMKDRTFLGYTLMQGFIFVGVFAYISGSPFVYQKIYGISPQLYSLLFSLNGISLILGSQFVKKMAGKIAEQQIVLIGLAVAFISGAAVMLIVFIQGPLHVLVIALFMFVGSTGIISSASFTLAVERQGHIAGSASALLGVSPTLLGAIFGPLVGIAGENSAMPFGSIIFCSGLVAVLIYFVLIKNAIKAKSIKSQIHS